MSDFPPRMTLVKKEDEGKEDKAGIEIRVTQRSSIQNLTFFSAPFFPRQTYLTSIGESQHLKDLP